MRRPVLTKPDRVVRKDVDRVEMRQRGQSNGRPHVIGEDEEGATERNEAAVQRDAIERRGHAMLAHTKVKVAGRAASFDLGVVRAREVGRSTDELGKLGRDRVQDLARRRARSLRILRPEYGKRGIPSVRQSAGQPSFQLHAELAMCRPVAVPLLPPFGL